MQAFLKMAAVGAPLAGPEYVLTRRATQEPGTVMLGRNAHARLVGVSGG